MKVLNPEISKILQQYNISLSDGTIILLTIYHKLDIISLKSGNTYWELIEKQVNLTKIVERNYEIAGEVIWNVPLYLEDLPTPNEWDWILDWREMFGRIRGDAIGSRKNCFTKMKKFFSEHPEVRKEDVIKATHMYLNDFVIGKQSPKYLQMADYFISKIIKAEGGTQYGSRLEMYLEIIKKQETKQDQATDNRSRQIVQ